MTVQAIMTIEVRERRNEWYRSIDTAQAYGNEEGVGQAMQDMKRQRLRLRNP